MPLAPVCRPKDIPEDHEVDVWTYQDWKNVALTGSTEYPTSKKKAELYQEENGVDPRIVQDLDPRIASLTKKLLDPLLSKEDTLEGIEKAINMDVSEEEDLEAARFHCTHQKEPGDVLDVEGAKRLMRKKLRNLKQVQSEEAPQTGEPVRHEVENEAFDVNGFRRR